VLDDNTFAFVFVSLTSASLIYYLISIFKDRMNDLGVTGVIIITTGMFYAAFMVYLLTKSAHHKILPHFEAAEDVANTRMKRAGKVIGFIVITFGLIGTILSIIQFFSPGK
jgi:hypothetical protein